MATAHNLDHGDTILLLPRSQAIAHARPAVPPHPSSERRPFHRAPLWHRDPMPTHTLEQELGSACPGCGGRYGWKRHPGPSGTIQERSLARIAGRQVGVAAPGTNRRRSRSRTVHHRTAHVLVDLSEGHLLRIVSGDANRRPLGATGLRPSPPVSINAASRDRPRTPLPAAGRIARSCESSRRARAAGGEARGTEVLTRQRVPEHEPGGRPWTNEEAPARPS